MSQFDFSNYDFTGKVVLVTGPTGRSMGRTIAKRFFDCGAALAICGRNEERIKDAQAWIGGDRAGEILAMQADMSKVEDNYRFVEEAEKRFGRVDILVNNAGVQHVNAFLDMSQEDWDTTMETKARGYYFTTQAFAKACIKEGHGGSVVNIGSPNGHALVTIGHSSYAAANAVVDQMTRSTARELGPYGIRVNNVLPGSTPSGMNYEKYQNPETEEAMCAMIPLRRRATHDDMAALCLFLASDQAEYITGELIASDGGLSVCCG